MLFQGFQGLNMREKLLTAREVADRMGVTVQTVSNLCQAGVFPNAFKVGTGRTSPWRIPAKDFGDYLKQQRAQPVRG
jgi:excisionase family DNA binding protein